ncbi:MAG TPA: hypothetical protein EYN38_10145 [Flavobacteriales bacterium]|nr:hypothetical protein [Flavobacteriales bacterium]HIO73449.1 hypothetical protein [Flavobacteriales bacterium]
MKYFILITIATFCTAMFPATNGASQGPTWIVYNTTNSEIPQNYILSMGIDKNDNKWIGTSTGLVKFDGTNWIIYDKKGKKDIQYSTVRNITIDSENKLWTGSWGDGMAELVFPDGNASNPNAAFKWIYYRNNNSAMPHNTVKTVCVDNEGSKWIGTGDGMVLMESTGWGAGGLKWQSFYKYNSGLPHDAVYSIVVDRFNNKWIGTFGGGLAKFDGLNWTVYDIRNSALPDNFIISMVMDKKQKVWMGTYSGGLASFDGTKWKIYKTSNSDIPDNVVYALAVDNHNNLWIGTLHGLAKFDGAKWTKYDLMNSGKPYTVSTIAIDKFNNKWIGTGDGLAVYNESGIKK